MGKENLSVTMVSRGVCGIGSLCCGLPALKYESVSRYET